MVGRKIDTAISDSWIRASIEVSRSLPTGESFKDAKVSLCRLLIDALTDNFGEFFFIALQEWEDSQPMVDSELDVDVSEL